MSLLLTHYFLRFTLSFSRSRRGLAGLERGKYEEPEVGEGDKLLILGDYLGSQEVGEGGELCPFHEVGKMGA